MSQFYSTGEVAQLLGVPFYVVMYAERAGKIPPVQRYCNRRAWSSDDLKRLRTCLQEKKTLLAKDSGKVT